MGTLVTLYDIDFERKQKPPFDDSLTGTGLSKDADACSAHRTRTKTLLPLFLTSFV